MALVLGASSANAERANLFVNLYGLNRNAPWEFDVKLISGANQLARKAEFTQRPNDYAKSATPSGIQLKISDVYFEPGDPATLISIIAYQEDSNLERRSELFFPVQLLDRPVSNGDNIFFNEKSLRGRSSSSDAARYSYPFWSGDSQFQVEADSLVTALNAVREIAKRPELTSEVWNDIYLKIQRSAHLIAQRNDVLRTIVQILNEYKNVNKTAEFVQFYMLFLEKMISEDLGNNIQLNDSELINDYFLEEIVELAKSNPKAGFSHMNEVLEAFEETDEYERCILAATAFQQGIHNSVTTDPNWWRGQKRREIRRQLFSGLTSATRCAQFSYVEANDTASRNDVSGGANFTVNTLKGGYEFADSYVEMIEALESQNITTMDHKDVQKFYRMYELELGSILGN